MNEFQGLVDTWLDGELTPAQFAELNRQLKTDPQKQDSFIQEVRMHVLLRKRHRIDASLAAALGGEPPARVRRRPLATRRAAQASLALAAVVLAAVLIIPQKPAGDTPRPTSESPLLANGGTAQASAVPESPNAVARVERASGEIDSTVWRNGILYPGDRLRFERGAMRLRFLVGATVALDGPVDLEIASASRAVLHAGQATAEVEESGHGFTIATPTADVVDLGTKFGVKVQNGVASDVVVFEGQVDIGSQEGPSDSRATPKRLRTGEAVRLEAGLQPARIPMIWQRNSDSGLSWSSMAEFDGRCAISSVRDNLTTTARPKFYSVVPEGFAMNAKIYVDRPYVWTGWDTPEIPRELAGGDYIQTFCDDRNEQDFQMKVGVSAPAVMYVLFDARIRKLPGWLTSAFTETETELALKGDVSAFLKTRQQLESGGQEVDPALIKPKTGWYQRYRFNVWRRDIETAEEVSLGAVAAPTHSMYSVVVVPRNP